MEWLIILLSLAVEQWGVELPILLLYLDLSDTSGYSAEALIKRKSIMNHLQIKVLKRDISKVNNVTLIYKILTYTTELKEAVQSADLVIEAVIEIMELKVEHL